MAVELAEVGFPEFDEDRFGYKEALEAVVVDPQLLGVNIVSFISRSKGRDRLRKFPVTVELIIVRDQFGIGQFAEDGYLLKDDVTKVKGLDVLAQERGFDDIERFVDRLRVKADAREKLKRPLVPVYYGDELTSESLEDLPF